MGGGHQQDREVGTMFDMLLKISDPLVPDFSIGLGDLLVRTAHVTPPSLQREPLLRVDRAACISRPAWNLDREIPLCFAQTARQVCVARTVARGVGRSLATSPVP